jgi:hypothetical protein
VFLLSRPRRKVALTVDAKNLLAACVTRKSSEDSVFTRRCGNSVKDFRVAWDKLALAAGAPGLLFHDLRALPSATCSALVFPKGFA